MFDAWISQKVFGLVFEGLLFLFVSGLRSFLGLVFRFVVPFVLSRRFDCSLTRRICGWLGRLALLVLQRTTFLGTLSSGGCLVQWS
jgi:hypothetical protein